MRATMAILFASWLAACSGSERTDVGIRSELRLWKLGSGRPTLLTLARLQHDMRALAVSRTGVLAVGGRDRTIETYILSEAERLERLGATFTSNSAIEAVRAAFAASQK